MIADKKYTDSRGNTVEYDNKIIGDLLHVVVGFSGSVIPFEQFRENINKRVREMTEQDKFDSSNLIQKLAKQVGDTNLPFSVELDKFNVLIARQYPNEKDSDLVSIDTAGQPIQVKQFTAIGSAGKFATNVLDRILEDRILTMMEFAVVSYFLIKYIECLEIDSKVGIGNEKPQIYFLSHKGKIDRYPFPHEMKKIENQANKLLDIALDCFDHVFK